MKTTSLFLALAIMALAAFVIGCRPAQPPAVQPTAQQPPAVQPTAQQPPAQRSAVDGPYPGAQGSPAPDRGPSTEAKPPSDPAAAQDLTASGPVAQPTVARPAVAQPAVSQPAVSQPAVSQPAISPAAAACGVARAGSPVTRDAYKHDVACRIHARNGTRLYEGAPPPVLRSVVVLSLRIDAKGRPVRIGILRSNGIRELERRAMQSVRDAAPFPVPGAGVLRQGGADITETWLFRDDGRFQVRTLAMVQAHSGF